MIIRTLAGTGVVLLALTGCGGNDDAQAKEAISKELQSNKIGDFSLTKKDADCIANGMVDKVAWTSFRSTACSPRTTRPTSHPTR
ncbi:MAG: hypothetical protein R2734_15385 [Nocardioides sp.]